MRGTVLSTRDRALNKANICCPRADVLIRGRETVNNTVCNMSDSSKGCGTNQEGD